ncbi:uncharacterized protein CPUR_03967 [Claviceps purpurea 20.1]|uniref:ORC6 first cyclin-like domain-containing protein n=1 Tax=Claviceps purpurea (strain 20.1) TaxID=1111077 RepID=M1WEJ7_CLAP2|nr:uncharacterized protein CPUR_03967 [Claviceps purpurea 20.1]
MSRQIEQALLSLMPTYGSDLPPSLVELAGSLLAQSRHRASTLKADEEIARQLKTSLDLPPIAPRPPIPPRIYNRLYAHLDAILPNASTTARSSRVRIPSRRIRENADTMPIKSQPRAVPSRGTPTKEMSLAKFRVPSRAASALKARKLDVQGSRHHRVHPWIQPVIRHMCAESGQKKLAPTIFAGIECTLVPDGRPAEDAWLVDHVTDLVAALYFFVMMRVRSITSVGAGINRESYVPLRKEILTLLAQAGQQVAVPAFEEDDAFWAGWRSIQSRDFDAAVAKVNENKWLSGDWYDGIVDVLCSTDKADVDMLEVEQEQEERQASLPTRRADAMLQEQNDYLSETRRADFAAWRDEMLGKIARAVPKDVVKVDA